jgi:hypothetical protein
MGPWLDHFTFWDVVASLPVYRILRQLRTSCCRSQEMGACTEIGARVSIHYLHYVGLLEAGPASKRLYCFFHRQCSMVPPRATRTLNCPAGHFCRFWLRASGRELCFLQAWVTI